MLRFSAGLMPRWCFRGGVTHRNSDGPRRLHQQPGSHQHWNLPTPFASAARVSSAEAMYSPMIPRSTLRTPRSYCGADEARRPS